MSAPTERTGPQRPEERTVEVNGQPCRVWEAGEGRPLGYLAGLGGFPLWPPVLAELARHRRVICPSLPGFPGGRGHDRLDAHLDWLVAARDLLNKAGLTGDTDLVGVSVGGAIAADVAAIWPHKVSRLALLAPFGLYDPAEPVADVFAQAPGELPALLCADPAKFKALTEPPEGADPAEWEIEQVRGMEAAARLLWPLGDTRLERRLGRILAPTLLLWGDQDRVIPPAYAQRFAAGLSAPARTRTIPGAGHLADVDQPQAVAQALLEFFA